jgi:hypothetical protein
VVAVLEPEDKAAAVLIVTQHRARLVPDWSTARADAAKRIFAHRIWKRQAAEHAPRRREEGDPAPAPAA